MQIVVEQSNVVKNGATILVPGGMATPIVGLGGSEPSLVPQQIDTVNEKSFSGSVMAKDGNSVAVGGLIQEGAGNNQITTPFLGDVPILGFFFRQEAQTRTRTELVIIIKPHIITTPPDGQVLTEECNLLGFLIDPATGAMWRLNNELIVTLPQIPKPALTTRPVLTSPSISVPLYKPGL